jgi:hypothetical protein
MSEIAGFSPFRGQAIGLSRDHVATRRESRSADIGDQFVEEVRKQTAEPEVIVDKLTQTQ